LLLWSQRLRRLLPQLQLLWQLQRWLVLFRWQRWQLRSRHSLPLSLQLLWWSLLLQLLGLPLVLSQLPSVVLASQVCPRPVPLLPIHFARRWLLPLPLLPLQQQLSLQRPSRLLCRLSSLRWLSQLQLPMLRLLLLLQQPSWRLQRLRERFHWLQWLLRLRHSPQLSLQSLWWSLQLQLLGLPLALSPLPSVVLGSQVYPRPVPLWPIRFELRWLLPLPC
jgi:hypothetical protein